MAAGPDVRVALETRNGRDACDLARVRAQVVTLVGRDPFDDRAPIEITIESRAVDDADEAILSVVDAGGERGSRTVSARTCDELVTALAVAVALAIESLPPPAEVTPREHPSAEIDIDAEEPPTVTTAVTRHLASRAFDIVADGVGGPTDRGWRGSFAFGARTRRGHAALEVEAEWTPSETVAVGATGSVHVSSSALAISPCVAARGLFACGTAATGWIRGTGVGLFDPHNATTLMVALGGRVGWERPLTVGFAIRVFGEVRARVTTTRFLVDQMPVWTSPGYDARAGIGLVAHLP